MSTRATVLWVIAGAATGAALGAMICYVAVRQQVRYNMIFEGRTAALAILGDIQAGRANEATISRSVRQAAESAFPIPFKEPAQ